MAPVMKKAAVLGATGATGREIARELVRRGVPVRVVSRSAENLARDFGDLDVERHAADLVDPHAARAAAADADLLFHCVGLPAETMHLLGPIAENVAATTTETGARGVLVTSYWSYEPVRETPIREDHPREPRAVKCRYRKEEEDAFAAAGAAVVCLPDFYGPGASAEVSLLNQAVRSIATGMPANWVGSLDAERDFLYLPDLGRPIVDLALADGDVSGRWHLTGSGAAVPRDLLAAAAKAAGAPLKVRRLGPGLAFALGLVSRQIRALRELIPLYSNPAVMDGAKLRARIGEWPVTPYAESIPATLALYR